MRDLVEFFQAMPEIVACDLHPDYGSTRHAEQLAEQWQVPLVRVQHHHAHVLSAMAEWQLTGPVLGLSWDGTGYGLDGTVVGRRGDRRRRSALDTRGAPAHVSTAGRRSRGTRATPGGAGIAARDAVGADAGEAATVVFRRGMGPVAGPRWIAATCFRAAAAWGGCSTPWPPCAD